MFDKVSSTNDDALSIALILTTNCTEIIQKANTSIEAVLIPWEISALNLVLTYWRNDIPLAAVCAGCIVL